MAKRKKQPSPKAPEPTSEYADSDGNVLVLRQQLSAKTIKRIAAERAKSEASSVDDDWRRRQELLFERLAVSWQIAGLPLTEQAMLLGRYRMADAVTQRWVRETIQSHLECYLPELG